MRLVIRAADGTAKELSELERFVELHDKNKLVAVTYVDDAGSAVLMLADDPGFHKYCELFGIPRSGDRVVKLKD